MCTTLLTGLGLIRVSGMYNSNNEATTDKYTTSSFKRSSYLNPELGSTNPSHGGFAFLDITKSVQVI